MHGYVCPECGAFLDPGERCDCQDEKEQKSIAAEEFEKEISQMVVVERNGQLRLAV